MNEKYHKLGGWLLFLVVANTTGILWNFYYLINWFKFTATASNISAVAWFSMADLLLTVALVVVFIVLIIIRNSHFLLFYELTSLINLVMNIILVLLNPASLSLYIIQPVIAFFIWTTYFRKSCRVYVYMGGDAYLRKSIFFKRAAKDPPEGE